MASQTVKADGTISFILDNMGYEEHVYLAKLAEQAERYEGDLSPSGGARGKLT